MDKTEITNAARLLKDYCEHKATCTGCPFAIITGYDALVYRCKLSRRSPAEWEIDHDNS